MSSTSINIGQGFQKGQIEPFETEQMDMAIRALEMTTRGIRLLLRLIKKGKTVPGSASFVGDNQDTRLVVVVVGWLLHVMLLLEKGL
jgi:hypothetical protein